MPLNPTTNHLAVGQLRKMLVGLPAQMRVGVYDQDDLLCRVQIACVSSLCSGEQVFHLRADGGDYLEPQETDNG